MYSAVTLPRDFCSQPSLPRPSEAFRRRPPCTRPGRACARSRWRLCSRAVPHLTQITTSSFKKGSARTQTQSDIHTHAHARIPEAWCTHMNSRTRRRNSRACSSGTAAADAKAIWPKRQLSHLVNTVCASENETAFSDLNCLLLVFSDVFAEHYCYCFLLPNHRRNFLERV